MKKEIKMIIFICLAFQCYQCYASSSKIGRQLIVYFKDEKSANNAILYSTYASSIHGYFEVKKSSIDPKITLWNLPPNLSDEYVDALIEYLRYDMNVEELEDSTTFYPTF